MRPATAVTAVLAALSPLAYHTYIVRLGLGLEGAALAVVSLQAVSALLLAGYTAAFNWSGRRRGERATWHGWSGEALRGWGEYLALAIPSVIMVCMKVRGVCIELWAGTCLVVGASARSARGAAVSRAAGRASRPLGPPLGGLPRLTPAPLCPACPHSHPPCSGGPLRR